MVTRRDLLTQAMGAAVLASAADAYLSTLSSGAAWAASGSDQAATGPVATGTPSLAFDTAKWSYDKANDVYYRIGAFYCAKPAAEDYEYLGIYVPGAYLTARKNSDGTYTAAVNHAGKRGSYTAQTAPIVMPINTPGYAPQKPPTSYSYNDISSYMKAGFVYVAAGLRGRGGNTSTYTGNAPWGVTDLKAAVRYLRYNSAVLPGHKDRIFVFGVSGGGAQGSVAGSSGDSPLYTPYLESIGAAMRDARGEALSDAINGVMAWVPITNLPEANLAYEWNMGQFATTGTRASGTWTAAYSKDLARAFPAYINRLGLTDPSGRKLTLAKSSSGIYLAGAYYDHLVSVIETSLNNFLSDTTFPYIQTTGGAPGGSGGAPGGSGGPPGTPGAGGPPSSASAKSTTYKTVDAYIKALNSAGAWIIYDAKTKKATVTALSGFIKSQKPATKDVGAFDAPARNATENVVFGLGDSGLHFSRLSEAIMSANEGRYSRLKNWSSAYAASGYATDFGKADSVGKKAPYRADMYNPLYYLSGYYAGYKSAKVAAHWRIRTGIMQGDTANTTEINLALALQNYGIKSVDFATVWGQGHTDAERKGNSTTNFISWVREVVPG